MNVGQMHTAIQQGVDKINSLQADMLLPQEIDIELNKAQIRFINTKYGGNNAYRDGFEESQKRIDDLRSLVREYTAPTTYKEQYNNNYWVDQFQLPIDYLYLVNQRSEIWRNRACETIAYTYTNYDPVSYIVIPFDNFNNGTEFISNLELVADPTDGTLGQVTMLPGIAWNTYTYPADVVNLQTAIATSTNWGAGFEFHWESYGNIYVANAFIVIVDEATHSFFNWDSSVTNAVSNTNLITSAVGSFPLSAGLNDSINTLAYGQFTADALGNKRVPLNNAVRDFALNKFVQLDDIAKLLTDPFNTTKYTSPLTTIRGRNIDIYTSDIFIIDKLKITYIRKPGEISLPLGISCELPDHCHQEIVDMAVSSLLEGLSDPRYKTHQLEVGKNE